MTQSQGTSRIRWRWGIGVGVAMMLIAIFPQIHFAVYRGQQWHGANAVAHPDEVAYSAYLESLIEGKPRRYDPYTGRSETGEASAPESLFSIQVVPAYAVALPARWLGLSASTVFMVFPALCALASSLAIFWFLSLLTREPRFSAAGVLVMLGFGTLIARQGIVRYVPSLDYLIPVWISNHVLPPSALHLPFLRFYQPAVAFPLFFVLCALVWHGLTSLNERRALIAATGAGLTCALLIFSYFYLWTAAAAWLGCVSVLWLIARRSERKRAIKVFGIVAVLALTALIPYLLMLSHRAATVDSAQALVFTHRPDLFRLSEIVSLLLLALLGVGAWRGILHWRDPVVLVTGSLALTVFVVFNQQVITGRSLQPIHYEWFIANYCALTALVLAPTRQWNQIRWRLTNKRLITIALVALVWGFAEVWLAASVNFAYNTLIDEARPAALRLATLAKTEAPLPKSNRAEVVLMADFILADRLPTDAPQAVLWAPRMLVFPGVGESENRERFRQQLYYLGYDEKKFWAEADRANWNFYAGMFPYFRLSRVVAGSTAPISPEELRAQLASYLKYVQSFNRERAASPTLSYFVVEADKQPDYANLDRWYQRDAGERIGKFVLYRLKLRE